jgi:hypothetical protein
MKPNKHPMIDVALSAWVNPNWYDEYWYGPPSQSIVARASVWALRLLGGVGATRRGLATAFGSAVAERASHASHVAAWSGRSGQNESLQE